LAALEPGSVIQIESASYQSVRLDPPKRTRQKKVIIDWLINGCETWSHKLREEHRLRVFENRVLRRIFGPKRV
jgi:hypothetical protein